MLEPSATTAFGVAWIVEVDGSGSTNVTVAVAASGWPSKRRADDRAARVRGRRQLGRVGSIAVVGRRADGARAGELGDHDSRTAGAELVAVTSTSPTVIVEVSEPPAVSSLGAACSVDAVSDARVPDWSRSTGSCR